MRKIKTAVSLLIALTISSCIQVKQEKKYEPVNRSTVAVIENEVETPFGKATITEPDFDKSEEFLITDFGAVTGDKEKISEAIGKAIDEANRNGGGKVVIPAGEWLTKKVHLKSNVNLHLEKDSNHISHYGAKKVAELFVNEIKEQNLALQEWLK